jgi:uncharacterized protein (TIGR02231 family)
MRLIFAALLTCMPLTGWADDISTTSRVVAAKVFPSSASITRAAEISLPAGNHQITVSDMPQYFNLQSLQVGLDTAGGVILRAKRFLAESVPPAPVKTPQMVQAEADLVQAEVALNRLEQERAKFEAVIASAELRIRFLETIASGEGPGTGEDSALSPDAMAGLASELGAQISAASLEAKAAVAALHGSARELEELVDAVARAEMALRLATPKPRDTGALVLEVSAAAPYEGDLFLSYVSGDVSWQPSYELYLEQTGNQGDLRMIRQAAVRQATGEDWQGAEVTLSTADLHGRAEVIIPRSTIFWLQDKDQERLLSKVDSNIRTMSAPSAEPMVELMEADVATSTIALQGQTLEFNLGPVAMIRGTGEPSSVRLDVIDRVLPLYARANARRDQTALLYADLTNETGGSLLAGQAMVYRDGVLVTTSSLPQTANGDITKLPLGPLNGILLEHRTLETQAGDSGFVKSKETRRQKFEVLVDSYLDYDIDLTVYAALPVSEDEDLTVRVDAVPPVSEQSIEGRRGVVGWTLPMAAGSAKKISYGWEMRWPDDQILLQR